MSKIITYYLKNRNYNSDNYYVNIAIFSKHILDYMNESLKIEVKELINFIKSECREPIRYKDEYIIDFLITSILYKVYIRKAMSLTSSQVKIIRKNTYNINKNKINKRVGNLLKGQLSTMYLLNYSKMEVKYNIVSMEKLITYLELTNEFREETKRVKNIYAFILKKNEENKEVENKLIKKLIDIGSYFEESSKNNIGKYTKKVNKFLEEDHRYHRYKEDVIYTGRKEVEYHLNMVGASIMSEIFYDEFINLEKKLLVIPSCMKINNNYKCRAKKTNIGYYCSMCNTKCKVRELTKIGEKTNFKVFVVTHQSEFNKIETRFYKNKGIIGVSCVLNLISGGLKLRDLGSIPQCILLDYCGCKAHWHDKGIITDINIHKLYEMLKIE